MVRLLRTGALSASVALLVAIAPTAADAQAGGGGATTGAQTTDAPRQQEDDGFDPGWFGLLGLAGLFGLRKPREERTRLDATPVQPRRP